MKMIQICKTEMCTGCAACVSVCGKSAITMQPDDKGFIHPVIRQDRCIDCGLCRKVCAQNDKKIPMKKGRIVAALAIDDELREKSSSGGIFSLLAEKIIINGGMVFGAAMQNDLRVRHTMVSSIEGLSQLRGSKYVQSEIGDCYKQAEEYLKRGHYILFSGTPCQVDALKRYLGKEYERLLTVDIICHGVPSPRVLLKYIESRENANNKKAVSINFREKDPGWTSFSTVIQFEDGTKEVDNSYYYFFVRNYCIRESCSKCIYSSTERVGDISLGDFWGYKESAPEHIEDDDHGISLVGINSQKGEDAFHAIKSKVDYAKRTFEDAVGSNSVLLHPCVLHDRSTEFWDDFLIMEWDALVDKYGIPRRKKPDTMSTADRVYYAKPYKKRHMRHLIHCAKTAVFNKLRR